MNKTKQILLLVFCAVSAFNCGNDVTDFYTKKGGWDYKRIPLIEPYVATNGGTGWGVQFYNVKLRDENWSDISRINVIDSIIVIHWIGVSKITEKSDTTWSFIVPKRKIEAKFRNEKSYLDSLSYYTNEKPVYREVEEVWDQFKKNTYLEWFPEKHKPENRKKDN